jgi:prepilin-type N-terminal cleavage/methylation domain-containing protein
VNFAQHHAGFSLVEVMIAIVILGVVLVGLTQGITTALTSTKESEWQTTGALFAAGQIETLRAEKELIDGETSGDCGDILPQYRWKQTVSPTDVDGLHSVEVTVENSKTGVLVYELKTLLFEPGSNSSAKPKDPKSKGKTP